MNNKLEYLKKSVHPKAITFLERNLDRIPKKLLVWVARNLDLKFSRNEKGNTFSVIISDSASKVCLIHEKQFVSMNMFDYIKYIEDWFMAESPDISQMTIKEAYAESRKWHNAIERKRFSETYREVFNKSIVFSYKDHSIVRIRTAHDLKVEGRRMNHCVGSYMARLETRTKIFSVRDKMNQPHITIELYDKALVQMKGVANSAPPDEYLPVVMLWIAQEGIDASNCPDFIGLPEKVLSDNEKTGEFDAFDLIKQEVYFWT